MPLGYGNPLNLMNETTKNFFTKNMLFLFSHLPPHPLSVERGSLEEAILKKTKDWALVHECELLVF